MRVRGISFLLTLFCNLLILFGQECIPLKISDDKGDLENNKLVIDDCGGSCIELKAEYKPSYRTDKYKVRSSVYRNIEISNVDAKVEVLSDRYSKAIKLPFKFDFFGEVKESVVFGENGVISFNPKWAGQYCPLFPDEKINAEDKGSLLTHTIFGSMQDLSFSEEDKTAGIYFRTEGKSPCRKFVVTYYKANQFGCDQTSTFQIVLEELTNKVYVYVKNKPQQCGSSDKKTAIGIRGAGRTEGIAPKLRDTGVWKASNEGWEFYPAGDESSKISWVVGDKTGDSNTFRLCKDKVLPKNFSVTVSYLIGGEVYYKNQKTINVSIDQKIPILKQKSIIKNFCFTEKKTNLIDLAKGFVHNDINNFNVKFYERSNYTMPLSNLENYKLSGDKKLYVRITNKADSQCFQDAVLDIKHAQVEINTQLITLTNTSNGVKDNFALSYMKNLVFDKIDSRIRVEYFNSEKEAREGRNSIRNVEMKEGESKIIWMKLTQKDSCEDVTIKTLELIMKPSLKVRDIDRAIELPKLCDNGNDGRENFDILNFMRQNAQGVKNRPTDKIVGVYSSVGNAKYGIGALDRIDEAIINSNKGYLYVKVQSTDGKMGIAKVRVKVNFSQVEIEQNYIRNVKFNDSQVNGFYSLNLDQIKSELIKRTNYTEAQLEVKYYDNRNNAINGNASTIMSTQSIKYLSEKDFSKTFYIRFQLKNQDCFTITSVKLNFYNPRVSKKEIYACASSEGQEVIKLSDYNNEIMGGKDVARKYNISYIFNGQEVKEKILKVNNSEEISVKVSQKVGEDIFFNIYPVKFNLVSPPKVNNVTKIRIDEKQCFNTFYDEDGKEVVGAEINFDDSFKKNITSEIAKCKFEFYRKNENGDLIEPITEGGFFAEKQNNIIYAKISDPVTGCFSVSQLDIEVQFMPKVILAKSKGIKIESCAPDGSGGVFNYDEIKEKVFNGEEHPEWTVSYFLSRSEAIKDIYPEENTVDVKFQDPIKRVYMRVQNKYGCFAIAEADLYSFYPPKLEAGKVYELCDSNLDGKISLDIEKLKELIFADENDEGILFHYYTSQVDLDAQINEILVNNEFEIGDLPEKIFVRSQRKGLPCYSQQTISLNLKKSETLVAKTIRECEREAGIATFNLKENQIPNMSYKFYRTMEDLQNDRNEIINTEAYESADTEIFAKVQVENACPALQVFNLEVKERPKFSFDEITFCKGGQTSEIVPNIVNKTPDLTFKWYNPKGEVIGTSETIIGINEVGMYALEITKANGCSTKVSFEVKNSPKPKVDKIIVENDKITVFTKKSEYEVEYSIDGGKWQNSNIFEKQEKGKHTIYARYKKYKCAEDRQVLVLKPYNIITPNGDGINDVWEIKDLDVFGQQSAKLRIFDRYGVLLYEQVGSFQFKWDGKKNGQKLPTTDYYYILDLPDGRTYKGNITVKNY
ncbi:T9SS type B sorting domain-containing protein [Ornithobacterium rhinotracheale]|uniref:T9SS type B sorting domain-containing protein n=2 Tax=Ornithobacterium rhinotracheale TaxID=28251 RepID=UPI0040372AEC